MGASWIDRIRENDVGHCKMFSMGHRKTTDMETTWLKLCDWDSL